MTSVRHLPTDILSLISSYLLPGQRTPMLVALSTTRQRARTLPHHQLPPTINLCHRIFGHDNFSHQVLHSWLACLQLALSSHRLFLPFGIREQIKNACGSAATLIWHGPRDRFPSAAWQARLARVWQCASQTLQALTLNLHGHYNILRHDTPLLPILFDWSETALTELVLHLPASWVEMVRWPPSLQKLQLSLSDVRSPVLSWATAPRLTDLELMWTPAASNWTPSLPGGLTRLLLMDWHPDHPLPAGLQSFQTHNILPTSRWAPAPLSLVHVEIICPEDEHPSQWPRQPGSLQSDHLLEWIRQLPLQSLSVTNFHPSQHWDATTTSLTLRWSSPLFGPRLIGLTKLTIAATQSDIHVISRQCRALTDLTILDWEQTSSFPLINIPSLIRLRCPYASHLDLTLLPYLETLCLTGLAERGQIEWPNIVQLPHAFVECSYIPDPTSVNPPDGGLICAGMSIPCPPVNNAIYRSIPATVWFPRVEYE